MAGSARKVYQGVRAHMFSRLALVSIDIGQFTKPFPHLTDLSNSHLRMQFQTRFISTTSKRSIRVELDVGKRV